MLCLSRLMSERTFNHTELIRRTEKKKNPIAGVRTSGTTCLDGEER